MDTSSRKHRPRSLPLICFVDQLETFLRADVSPDLSEGWVVDREVVSFFHYRYDLRVLLWTCQSIFLKSRRLYFFLSVKRIEGFGKGLRINL